ncbi:nucleotide disphospho-sugar-binding domain-containing protein [Streptomyces rishiriensis]|uniref:nucleotide disphospho-sugar-binding domain-containing protein n=1 Tax=Streptomyces rishiriensis TaxID=68264 RepID=UPI0037B3119B
MRVLFTSLPGIGHLFPMVPLAWALQAAGHTVLVATDREFLPVVTGAGLPAAAVRDPVDPVELFKPVSLSGLSGLSGLVGLSGGPVSPAERTGHRCAEIGVRALPAVRALVDAWRPDLVIAEPMELAGPAAATIAGVPWVRHSYGLIPPERLLSGAAAALDSELAVRGLSPWAEPAGTIDVCPDSLQPTDAVATTPMPMRYVPYNGPAVVPDWLLAGPSPRPRVCLTLGTSLPRRNPRVAPLWRLLLDELVALGQEVVIAIDESHRSLLGHLPGGVRAARIPLCDLLPTCTAIVHHGGSGSTMAAAAFGVPQLVVPHFADHFANAERITAVGAGTSLPHDTDDLARITAACALIVDDGPHRAISARLAEENASRPKPTEVAQDLVALVLEHSQDVLRPQHASQGRQ